MDCHIQNLPFDPTALHGLSEKLLLSHHQNDYGGAVHRLNAIRMHLTTLSPTTAPGYVWNGLKREELMATNAILLHELYFGCLGGNGSEMSPAMALALSASFGSVALWRDEFAAMGRAMGSGSGWVLLVYQPREGHLVNQWAADHTQALVGGIPLLALDMYEHAYHLDYGPAAGPYVEAFMANIAWNTVYARYQQAIYGVSESLGANHAEVEGALLVDVRREGVYKTALTRIAGAQWKDPSDIDRWAKELPQDRAIVVYCVYGHEVSRSAAMRLRAAGLNVRFLRGGIDAWEAAGQRIEHKATAT
jgi:Fe-Mn family superoxide dismutase